MTIREMESNDKFDKFRVLIDPTKETAETKTFLMLKIIDNGPLAESIYVIILFTRHGRQIQHQKSVSAIT